MTGNYNITLVQCLKEKFTMLNSDIQKYTFFVNLVFHTKRLVVCITAILILIFFISSNTQFLTYYEYTCEEIRKIFLFCN